MHLFFCLFFYFLSLNIPITYAGHTQNSQQIQKIDKIVVLKSKRQLITYLNDKKIKTYKIALGFNPIGHKVQSGDGKTPEGTYSINFKNKNSNYHKSLKISFPNSQDIKKAYKLGVNPGGDIYIHGIGKKYGFIGSAHTLHDWTLGCIALTNDEIDELWKSVDVGAVVIIKK